MRRAGESNRPMRADMPARGTKIDCRTGVLERSELRASDVLAIAESRALALVVPDYYAQDACEELAEQLLAASNLWTSYPAGSGAEHIDTLGSALYNCLGDHLSADCRDYFERAADRNRALRAVTAPWLHPADRVRIELDNEWPAGATLLRIDKNPAFYGLSRLVRSGGEIEPHTDRADWDLPCKETQSFRTQLFLNVYLSQSTLGGDLELWDMDVPKRADYDKLRSPESSYALDRRLLPSPTATISIGCGALVIANASKPHAVTSCAGRGQRLSVSGFLGYAGPYTPLRMFS